MGQITVSKCPIEGLYIIEPTVHGDNRGYFMETYNQKDMEEAGLNMVFVQDNQSMSTKGVLRGLHTQKKYPQGKLVRVIRGRVFDVAVDVRPGSETYGKWYGVELTEENKKQFYISEGFAHGFLVLSDVAEFLPSGGRDGHCLERPRHCRGLAGGGGQLFRLCVRGGLYPGRRHAFAAECQRPDSAHPEAAEGLKKCTVSITNTCAPKRQRR